MPLMGGKGQDVEYQFEEMREGILKAHPCPESPALAVKEAVDDEDPFERQERMAQEAQAKFDEFDVDGSGNIDRGELLKLLNHLGKGDAMGPEALEV